MKNFWKNNKENILIFLIPLLIFSLYLIAFFPGIITFDSNYQWQQVQSGLINDAHPFFTTYFMFLLSKIWNSPAIVILFQIIIFSLFWSCICSDVRKNSKNSKIFIKQLILTIVISFLPIFSIYSITLWKDILYSYYLLMIGYYIYVGINNDYNYSKKNLFVIGLLLALVFCYRHNGMITSVILLLYYIIIFIKRKINYKKCLIIIFTFIAFNIFVSIPKNKYLTESQKVLIETNSPNSLSTIDSYITWIYGSFINKNQISKEDLKKLNNILSIEIWKDNYSPFLINGISRSNLNTNLYNKNKSEFRKMFVKYSLKYPLTIIEHFIKSSSMLWCPFDVGYIYSFDYTEWSPKYEFNNGKLYGFENIGFSLPIFKKVVEKTTAFAFYMPVKLFYRPANAMYLSFGLLYILIKQTKKKKYWMLTIPMLANDLPLFAINVAQDLRYAYINYLTLLFICLIFVCEYKIKRKNLIKKQMEKKYE